MPRGPDLAPRLFSQVTALVEIPQSHAPVHADLTPLITLQDISDIVRQERATTLARARIHPLLRPTCPPLGKCQAPTSMRPVMLG